MLTISIHSDIQIKNDVDDDNLLLFCRLFFFLVIIFFFHGLNIYEPDIFDYYRQKKKGKTLTCTKKTYVFEFGRKEKRNLTT